jgi:hypothetical protein
LGELGPQPGSRSFFQPTAQAGEGHVLAGEPTSEDVDRFDRRPVDLRDVAVVGDAGETVGEDLRRCRFELDMPRDFAADDGLDTQLEAAVAAEQ